MSTVICNKCGQVFKYVNDMAVGFGYGSQFDMETWEFCMCDDCLEELAKTFKVVPKGFRVDGYSPEVNFVQHQQTFNDWKRTGKWEEMKYVPYDELMSMVGYLTKDYINDAILKYHPDKPIIE